MSEELAEYLHKMEDRPWPEYGRRNQPISKNQVARLLKHFNISPGTIRCGETTGKGYKLSQFGDVFARYLPSQTVTTSQVNATAGLSPISKRHKDEDVTVWNSLKATDTAGCDVVTVEKGGTGDMAAEYEREERLAIQSDSEADPDDPFTYIDDSDFPLSPETREGNRFLGPEPIPPMFDRRLGVSATKRKD